MRLMALEGHSVAAGRELRAPTEPLWEEGQSFPQTLSCRIDKDLEAISQCTVIIVPLGDVPKSLVDATAFSIRRELGLPVFAAPALPLQKSTRMSGLLIGRQWSDESIVESLVTATESFPDAPVKYLILTPADIYMEGTNYVFSSQWDWGAAVSFARFGEPQNEQTWHRTAKQALCALIKTFRVPPSPDRDCVTSYVRSIEEFDGKGNRPSAETRALFDAKLLELNRTWQEQRQAAFRP